MGTPTEPSMQQNSEEDAEFKKDWERLKNSGPDWTLEEAVEFAKKWPRVKFSMTPEQVAQFDREQAERRAELDAASSPADVVWSMHTKATIAIAAGAKKATLTQGGKTVEALLLSPSGAVFSSAEVTLQPPEKSTAGIRKLQVKLASKTTSARIAVLLAPKRVIPTLATVNPLADWPTKGPTSAVQP